MKKILLILLFISSVCNSEPAHRAVRFYPISAKTVSIKIGNAEHDSLVYNTKVFFAGVEAYHDSLVYNEFMLAYTESGLTWNPDNGVHRIISDFNSSVFDTAIALGCSYILRATSGMSQYIQLAKQYYPYVNLVMPTGGYLKDLIYAGDLPEIILTGSGIDTNSTGYKIEFFDYHYTDDCPPEYNFCPSFSLGRIVGKLTAIRDLRIDYELDSSLWAVRYASRMTATLHTDVTDGDGYGTIDMIMASAYDDTILPDPYDLLGNIGDIRVYNNQYNVYLLCGAVTNAFQYQFYCNDSLLTTTTNLNYTYSPQRLYEGNYEYKYRAIRREDTTGYSTSVTIPFRKYNGILIR